MHDENEPFPTLTFPLRVKRMRVMGEEDVSYRRRSRTPPSESFSYNEEHYHRRRYKSLPCRGLGNDAMSKALN